MHFSDITPSYPPPSDCIPAVDPMSSTYPLVRDFFLFFYGLTGKMTPWIDKLITYLSDPLQYDDPEPDSKHYNAGGTELVGHNLVQNLTKRPKTQHDRPGAPTVSPPPPTTHKSTAPAEHTRDTTTKNNDSPKHTRKPTPPPHTHKQQVHYQIIQMKV